MIQYFDDGDLACFNGYSFRKDKKTGYFLSSKKIGKSRVRLHVYVWEYYNGKIPSGYHVHHLDEDKNNNEPENLTIMLAEEHITLHGAELYESVKEARRNNVIENAMPKAKIWHSTEEGRKWHSEHAKQTQQNAKINKYICDYCGNEFETKNIYGDKQNKFCSNKCKAAHRRKSGVDDIKKICTVCEGEYIANKYQNTKRCSLCRNKKHRA